MDKWEIVMSKVILRKGAKLNFLCTTNEEIEVELITKYEKKSHIRYKGFNYIINNMDIIRTIKDEENE